MVTKFDILSFRNKCPPWDKPSFHRCPSFLPSSLSGTFPQWCPTLGQPHHSSSLNTITKLNADVVGLYTNRRHQLSLMQSSHAHNGNKQCSWS
uniref:Uncharacterized protein n=1 Tax=Arion vulgaris TaxID=1028688 RepID=A0A0B6YR72_9EUPU